MYSCRLEDRTINLNDYAGNIIFYDFDVNGGRYCIVFAYNGSIGIENHIRFHVGNGYQLMGKFFKHFDKLKKKLFTHHYNN